MTKTGIDLSISILLSLFFGCIADLFVICYLGKTATENFLTMADLMYKVNWHELPIELQRYFILMMANMQQPLYYHGFGVVILDLETYTSVTNALFIRLLLICLTKNHYFKGVSFLQLMNSVYTYYMMLKTLSME